MIEENDSDTLEILIAGNQRFSSGNPIHPHQSETRRLEVTKGQHPQSRKRTTNQGTY